MRRVALLALLVACSRPPLRFAPDHEFSAEEVHQIAAAAATWNAVTKPSHHLSVDRRGGYRIDKVESIEDGSFAGMFRRSEALIETDDDVRAPDLYALMVHEFGHALGLRHTCSAPGTRGKVATSRPCTAQSVGAMDPLRPTATLTEDDLAECRRAGACP